MAWCNNESFAHKYAKELLRDALCEHLPQSFRFWRQENGVWGRPIEFARLKQPRVLMEYPLHRRQCHWTEQEQIPKSYPRGRLPLAIADLAILDGSKLMGIIEICYKHPVSDDKLYRLEQLDYLKGIPVIEVSAHDILNWNSANKHLNTTANYVRRWIYTDQES